METSLTRCWCCCSAAPLSRSRNQPLLAGTSVQHGVNGRSSGHEGATSKPAAFLQPPAAMLRSFSSYVAARYCKTPVSFSCVIFVAAAADQSSACAAACDQCYKSLCGSAGFLVSSFSLGRGQAGGWHSCRSSGSSAYAARRAPAPGQAVYASKQGNYAREQTI